MFIDFLNKIAIHADALYILGDFFESYIGDDDENPWLQEIIHALSLFTQSGPPVYFMHGNRDFLVGKLFAKKTGVHLISDPTVIQLDQQKILLTHGDQLCTQDHAHQRFRTIAYNKLVQQLFLFLPLSLRRKIADQLRHESQQCYRKKSSDFFDVSPEAVDSMIKKYGANYIIHGHTHKPITTDKRIVLPAWDKPSQKYWLEL